jgi:hypothetical protein
MTSGAILIATPATLPLTMKLRLACLPVLAVALHAQTPAPAPALQHAAGAMDVETRPDTPGPGDIGRFTLVKHYHGGLDAQATGEMLGGGDPKAGTAGYVALETVTGTLDGHTGTFELMHWGTMEAGRFDLRVTVVPGSGTGGLRGLAGTLHITAAPGGQHTYALDYTLPSA